VVLLFILKLPPNNAFFVPPPSIDAPVKCCTKSPGAEEGHFKIDMQTDLCIKTAHPEKKHLYNRFNKKQDTDDKAPVTPFNKRFKRW